MSKQVIYFLGKVSVTLSVKENLKVVLFEVTYINYIRKLF